MRQASNRFASWLRVPFVSASLRVGVCVIALTASSAVLAQGTSPAREAPRPQDVDPAVNTSSPSQAPARDTPRPQDIDPAVNTSAAVPANEAVAPSSPAPPAPKGSASAKPAGSAATPAGASSTATPSTPSTSGSATAKPTTGAKPATTADGKPKGKSLDRLELDTTQITGNRELPKVLYIVPWKRADLGDLVGKPANSLLDEVLTPVDRDVFKRENRYYRALAPADGQPAGSNASSSSAPATGAAKPAATSSGSAAPASRDER